MLEEDNRVLGKLAPGGDADEAFEVFFGEDRGLQPYAGGGIGFDYLRNKHFSPVDDDFTRSFTGLSYTVRGGISARPGGYGALFLEGYYRGSTIDGDDPADRDTGEPADLEARSKGLGFRVGYRF